MTKLLTFKNIISLLLLLLFTFIVIYLMYPELLVDLEINENFQNDVNADTVRRGIVLAWREHIENITTTSPPQI